MDQLITKAWKGVFVMGLLCFGCWLIMNYGNGYVSAAQTNEILVSSDDELGTAIANAVPGDVIVMQDGIWKDIDIVFKGQGTEAEPITLKAQTQGQVIISGSSSLRIAGKYLVVDGLYFKDGASSQSLHLIEFRDGAEAAHHSRLTNTVISEFSKERGQSDVWVGLFGTHNRVDHSFFHGKTSQSALLIVWRPDETPQYHQIDHNYFKDIPVLGMNGAEAIRVGTSDTSMSDSHTTIEYNLFEQANGEGELISLKSGQNVIRHNTVIESQGSISLRHGNNNLVKGNFILGGEAANTGGIRVMGEDHTVINNYMQGLRGRSALSLVEGLVDSPLHGHLQVKNATISGNTLVNNDKNVLIGEMYDAAKNQTMRVSDSILKDNVIWGVNRFSLLVHLLDEPENMNYEGNIVYQGYVGVENEPGVLDSKPPLVQGEDGLYYYDDDSPLRDNIIGQPLQRTDAGPKWIQQERELFGIKSPEEPLVEFTFQPDAQNTANVKQTGSDPASEQVASTSVKEEEVADSAVESSQTEDKRFNYGLFFGIIVLLAVISSGIVRRVKRG